jgi:NAD(P)-dependent dehydrogenase (short-subunit alcohol dehydrogenase family)
MDPFRDRVAVVTGGAGGIGMAMARAFAARGARIVLADLDEEALATAEKELTTAGAEVLGVQTDVTRRESLALLADMALRRFGAVHIVCNNAGVVENNAPVWEYSLGDWGWVLGVNLMGVVHGIRSFVPRMLDGGEPGHVVNTASIGGLIAGSAMPIYIVSKHAVVALSECLYNDLSRRGAALGVSVLCPGWVRTAIVDSDRNRENPPDLSAKVRRSRDRFRTGIDGGIDPDTVGTIVLDHIKDDRFYILTHPHWKDIVADRFDAIMDGKQPASTQLPHD